VQGDGVLNYPGSHSFSSDGKTWHYGGAAYSNNISYTDGSSELLRRRERPHLVFDPTGAMVALTNGVIAWDDAGRNGDRSFTLVNPIGQRDGGEKDRSKFDLSTSAVTAH